MTDAQLLTAFATRKDQHAFAELVHRHIDWVYSLAHRLAPQSAEDITQAVFLLVSQKAPLLAAHRQFNGWLFRATRYCAANALKQQAARRRYEQEAAAMRAEQSPPEENVNPLWQEIAPHLDAALARLNAPDREALLLKYYQNKTAAEVGATLNISEEAAKKRLQRALDRLRTTLAAGTTPSSAALATALTANVTHPAPATIAPAIAGAKSATAASTLAKAAANAMWRAQAKIAAAIVIAASVAGTIAYEALIHGIATKPTTAIAAPATPTPQPVTSAAPLPSSGGAPGSATSQVAASAPAPSPLDPVIAMGDPSSSVDATRIDQIFTAVTPVETQFLDHARTLILATRNFTDACKTIDPTGSIPAPKFFAINMQNGKSLQDSVITQLDADNADIAPPIGGGAIRVVRTPSGWRIPVSWVLNQYLPPALRRHPQIMFDYMQSLTDLAISLTDQIKSKKLNTPDAVKSELDTRFNVIQTRLNDASTSARKLDRQKKPKTPPAATTP